MSEFDHPIREGAVLKLETEEPGVARVVVVQSRLMDIDIGRYKYELVDYSNTYKWTYHGKDVEHIFSDTGYTSDDTKIYQARQPELYRILTDEYGDLGQFPNGMPESIR